MPTDRKPTLVCGGGGIWGVAWMTGLVMGLADAGLDLRKAAAFVGTSAGSVMSAQLSSGFSLEELFERQTDPAKQPREPAPSGGGMSALAELMRRPWRDDQERLQAVCKLALEADTISVAERRANVVERLGLASDVWPETPLWITAVDAHTLDLRVFDASGGVSLVDAVSASCAVPGVWPPTPINGRRYVDGGFWRTAENAHLAEGSKAVLILAPLGQAIGPALGGGTGLTADVAQLEGQGATVVVISADDASLRTMAPGALDPATRSPAAEAGRLQGARAAAQVRKIWDSL